MHAKCAERRKVTGKSPTLATLDERVLYLQIDELALVAIAFSGIQQYCLRGLIKLLGDIAHCRRLLLRMQLS
jgi:hypothetical protein